MIKEASDHLCDVLKNALIKNMDLWEAYCLRNVFYIPPKVFALMELDRNSTQSEFNEKSDADLTELEQSLDRGLY
jgi:hypothetical protein